MPANAHLAEPQPNSEAPVVRVYTLGGFRVVVAGQSVEDQAWRRRAARQLFKVLLSRPGRRMTRDEVIELFWPESDTDAGSSNLRSTLYAMRHALEASRPARSGALISGDHSSVWLPSAGEVWSDADAFELLAAEAWRSPDPLPLLEEASRLYLGNYLPDDLYEEWAADRREALKRTWTELQFGLSQALEARSDVNAAVQPLERLLRADPCDERAGQELMKLLARHGRRGEALRMFQRLQQSLREELDVEPSADTLQLHRQISTGAGVPSAPIPAASFRCSYPFPAPAALIGREAELYAASQALAAGRTAGKVVLVAAPAGLGKSALLGQIVRQAQARGVLCLAGGCYEERGAVPFGPFHDALVDFLLAQPAEQIRQQLGTAVDDIADIVPELRYHLQLTSTATAQQGPARRMQAFGAIHACLRSLAERGPVLVCLEDLHAADEATVALMHYLARHTRRLPLVLLGTYRSDEAPAEQPLAQILATMARERLVQRIELNPLDRAGTGQLISTLLESPTSEELCESVYAATGGNPLFVEQLVLALKENGSIQPGPAARRRDDDPHVPPIVREVIVARLQRLDPSCRDLLSIASVIGTSFEHNVLLAVAEPLDEPTVLWNLDRAIDARVLQDVPGGYAFRHSLLREAVYTSISKPQRMLLHTRVGEALERLAATHANEHAAELARHFVSGGRAAALREKALRYSLQAGRNAAAVAANRDALAQFETAVEIAESQPFETSLQLEALEGQGHAQRELGHWAPAIDTMRRVLDLTDDPLRRAAAQYEIASAMDHLGQSSAAVAEVEAGLAELGELDGARARAARSRLLAVKAYVRFFDGRFDEVLAIAEQLSAGVHQEPTDPRQLALAHTVRGWAYMGRGRIGLALGEYMQAHQLAEANGDRVGLAMDKVTLGVLHYLGGSFADAREYLDQGSRIFRESASEFRLINALHYLGRVLLAEGNLDGARAQAETALALAAVHRDAWAADCHDLIATVALLRSEYDVALKRYETALGLRRSIGFRAGIVEAMVGIGNVLQLQGDASGAEGCFKDAASTAASMDPCPQLVKALRHVGYLWLRQRDFVPARQVLATALELVEQMPETLEYAPTLLAAAELSQQAGDSVHALARAEAAMAASKPAVQVVESGLFLAQLFIASGALNRAEAAILEALQLANRMAAPRLLGQAHQAAAELALARGDAVGATDHFKAALPQLDVARMRFECATVVDELRRLGVANIQSETVPSRLIVRGTKASGGR